MIRIFYLAHILIYLGSMCGTIFMRMLVVSLYWSVQCDYKLHYTTLFCTILCEDILICHMCMCRSFYTSDRFADIPIPPSEDWEAATGEVSSSSMLCNTLIHCLLWAVCCGLCAVCYVLCAVCYVLSAMCCVLSAMCCVLPASTAARQDMTRL